MRATKISAFSLLEILVSLTLVIILALMTIEGVKNLTGRAQSAKCVGNLRQLGAGAAAYAADHNNQWPCNGTYDYPKVQDAWISRKVRLGYAWSGLGKTYAYHQDKRLFYCPADTSNTRRALEQADWRLNGGGSIDGTYLIRGYGQTRHRPLGRTYAALGRRSMASCQWAYAPSNPVKLPLAFHEGGYPVLFSDGSVQVISFPNGSVDPENPPNIWNMNGLQTDIWEFFDGKLVGTLLLQ